MLQLLAKRPMIIKRPMIVTATLLTTRQTGLVLQSVDHSAGGKALQCMLLHGRQSLTVLQLQSEAQVSQATLLVLVVHLDLSHTFASQVFKPQSARELCCTHNSQSLSSPI